MGDASEVLQAGRGVDGGTAGTTGASDTPAGTRPGSSEEAGLVDLPGRPLGPRALLTRKRILEATTELLDETRLRDLRVIDIARRIGSSPATFYQYFKDVEDVVLCLAEQATAEMPNVAQMIEGDWEGEAGLERARAIAAAFIRHWDQYSSILRCRNMASEEGDPKFATVRNRAMKPVLTALATKISQEQAAGRLRTQDHPHAAAAALAAILERLAAYHRELEAVGVTQEHLVETSANIVYRTVTGAG